ncbi:MAG: SpoIIIAH-like family protein [Butyricicoccus sp.]
MISMKKRGAVYGVIGLMLCVAVYLNWSYFQSPSELTVAAQTDAAAEASESVYGEVTSVNGDAASTAKTDSSTDSGTTAKDSAPTVSDTSTSEDDPFAEARLNRQTARDQALSILKETVSSDDATEQAKEEASKQISEIASNSVKESKIESLIQNKGYTDAVVYIEDGTIHACVKSEGGKLSETDAAKIADIIVSETGADLSSITISDAE